MHHPPASPIVRLERPRVLLFASLLLASLLGCRSTPARPVGVVSYVGSSTVGLFIRDAQAAYGSIRFELDTEPESDGGEAAMLAGSAGLAGIARSPQPATKQAGVQETLIGRDAIAVVVNSKNPVMALTSAQLRSVFSGQVTNWSELGGPDLPLQPYIVGPESATHEVLRATTLGQRSYAGCQIVRPDRDLMDAVAADPGGIGAISFSFLEDSSGIHPVAVDGVAPEVTNFDYPISRPLYLLWKSGDPVLDAFIDWVESPAGQQVVMQRFVGRGVLGSVRGQAPGDPPGILIVKTPTYTHYDGGLYYYPHQPFTLHTREGEFLRSVTNHIGENDETPMRSALAPGTYLVRVRRSGEPDLEYFVTVESGKTTTLDVQALIGARGR